MAFLALFPLAALALGVIVSIYLFVKWLRHEKERPKFLLLWSLALFLMYWFQVPLALSLLGKAIVLTDFNLYFALTLPITFLSLIFVYIGLLEVLGKRLGKTAKLMFWVWFLSAVVFFGYYFISNEGVIRTYSMPLVGNIVFYLPIRGLIIFILFRHYLKSEGKTLCFAVGAILIGGESIIGIIRNFFVVKTVLSYPPAFWYVAMSSLKIFFILRTSSVIFLSLGFLALHRSSCKSRQKTGLKIQL